MKINKKSFLLIFCLIGIVVFYGFFAFYRYSSNLYLGVNGKPLGREITFNDVFDKPATDIIKLRIRNGTTGEAYETTDLETIHEFLALMNETTFKKQRNQRSTVGWSFYVDLIVNQQENSWLRITFDRVSFTKYGPNNYIHSSPYYIMNDSEEKLKTIGDFYNSLQKNY